MAINKVVYSGRTLIDLTSDTVSADKLMVGATAHDKSGNVIVGTMDPPSKEGTTYVEYDILLDSDGDPILDSSNQEVDGRLIYKLA